MSESVARRGGLRSWAFNGRQRFAVGLLAGTFTVGALVLCLWCLTEWSWLLLAGAATVVVLHVVAVVSLVLLALDWCLTSRPRPRGAWLATPLVVALLVANYAGVFVAIDRIAFDLARYEVTLVNEAETAWPPSVLVGGGVRGDVPALAPGATVTLALHFTQEGSLVLHGVEANAVPLAIDVYVTRGLGGALRLVRARDGTVVVQVAPGVPR